MSASGHVPPKARWALVICLLALGCLVGTSGPSAYADSAVPMATMAEVQHNAPAAADHDHDQKPGQGASGHCVDSGEQCHQGMFDNGSAAAPSGHTAIAVAVDTVDAQAVAVRPGTRPPRPPDLHALCVSRI